MNALLTIADVLLVITLLALAWAALRSGDLFRSCVLFIAYGLLMALVWARLRAPDLALAEAAIGSGLTGALLLVAWQRLSRRPRAGESASREAPPS